MKVTWLTESGLLFDTGKIKIMVDPYLSDSADGGRKRKIAPSESFLSLTPDVLLITHSHPCHLDEKTLEKILGGRAVTVLAPETSYERLLSFGGAHNLVLISPHTVWSEGGVTFYAVHAEHSDRCAVGYIIDDGKKSYYVSGDTLYNYDVIDDVLDLVPDGVDFAFLPINGRDNNMNATDAADLAYEIGAKCAVPVHYGLFDDVNPESFDFDDALIIKPYEETTL